MEYDRQVGMGTVRIYSYVDFTSKDIPTAANEPGRGGDNAQNSGRNRSKASDIPYHLANIDERVGATGS